MSNTKSSHSRTRSCTFVPTHVPSYSSSSSASYNATAPFSLFAYNQSPKDQTIDLRTFSELRKSSRRISAMAKPATIAPPPTTKSERRRMSISSISSLISSSSSSTSKNSSNSASKTKSTYVAKPRSSRFSVFPKSDGL